MIKNLKILVCCHKDDIYKNSEVFLPIHVGKALSTKDLGIIGDDTGDNISTKNASYCELTGIYWAWKNLKGVDYIGLCHYRRYFDFNHVGRRFFPSTNIKPQLFDNTNLNITPRVENWLNNGGCIISKPSHIHASLFMQYCEGHYSQDIKILGDIIKDQYPPKYFDAFISTMIEGNRFSPYNMFIMNWNNFNKYCSWLFPLLQKVEDSINITNYSAYQQRIFGFMGERLLNLYVKAEKMELMEVPIVMFSEEESIDNMPLIKLLIRNIIRDLAVKVTAEIPKI